MLCDIGTGKFSALAGPPGKLPSSCFLTCIFIDAAMESMTTAAATGPNSTVIDAELSCPREPETPGCVLYSFVICTVIIGLLAVFGSIGNVISFVVFHRDKIKTSTTFLFQVLSVRITSVESVLDRLLISPHGIAMPTVLYFTAVVLSFFLSFFVDA